MLQFLYRNPAACFLIILAVCAGGLYQFTQLPIALYPNTSQPRVNVDINFNSVSTQEFYQRWGRDIEAALQGIDSVTKVAADYGTNRADFRIDFDWGVKDDEANQKVIAAIDSFQLQMPRSWGKFGVRFDGQFSSRFFMGISSPTLSQDQLAQILKNSVKPSLQLIPGLAEVWIVDWSDRRANVTLSSLKLFQFGVTADDVRRSLEQRQHSPYMGRIASDDHSKNSFQVSLDFRLRSVDDIRNCVVASKAGYVVRVRDVATVTIEKSIPNMMFKSNGKRQLLFGGYAKPDANIKDVADRFVAESTRIAKSIDPSITVQIIHSPSDYIDAAVDNVLNAVIGAIIITTLLTFLFLSSMRDTFIICLSIPLSGLGGFVLMRLLGIEINLISMGAMALSVGMVVDGATVVLENAARHLREVVYPQGTTTMTKLIAAVKEVEIPVAASILTAIVVFIPLPFTAPLTSAVLGDLAIVVVCVMTVSLIITIGLIPPLIAFFQTYSEISGRRIWEWPYRMCDHFNRGFGACQDFYLRTLRKMLENPRSFWYATAGLTVLLLLGTTLMLTRVKREVMARPETSKVFINVELKRPNMTLDAAEQVIDDVEVRARDILGDDFKESFTQIRESTGEVLITIQDQSHMAKVKALLEEKFVNTVNEKYRIHDWTPTQLRIPDPPLIRINVGSAKSPEERRKYLRAIDDLLSQDERFGHVDMNPSANKAAQLLLTPKPNFYQLGSENLKLGSAIFSSEGLSSLLSLLISEKWLFESDFDGLGSLSIFLRFPQKIITSQQDLRNIPIKVGEKMIPLSALVNMRMDETWSNIYTEGGQAKAYVDVWAKKSREETRSELIHQVKKSIAEQDQVPREFILLEDMDGEINTNIKSLIVALVFALALITLVIVLQFASLTQTLIVLSAIPLGFVGVTWSLWVFNSTLGINSMLGIILLSGTAVNNSIIFVDFFNVRRAEKAGLPIDDLLIETAALRLRPIMITTLTTILGMLPIAFAWGEGATILQPLGIAVCGGLWLSTLLTIYAVPMLLKFATHKTAET